MAAEKSVSEQRYFHVEYQGRDNPTEPNLMLRLPHTHSTTEGFVAQHLPKRIERALMIRFAAGCGLFWTPKWKASLGFSRVIEN